MVALIAMVIITAVLFLGNRVNRNFECTGSSIESLPNPAACPT